MSALPSRVLLGPTLEQVTLRDQRHLVLSQNGPTGAHFHIHLGPLSLLAVDGDCSGRDLSSVENVSQERNVSDHLPSTS